MSIEELEESYLLSLNHDYQSLFIELHLLTNSGNRVKLFVHNKSTAPISVEYIGLTLKSNFANAEGVPSLGEIESINVTGTGINLEGDIGFIGIKADNWSIQNDL